MPLLEEEDENGSDLFTGKTTEGSKIVEDEEPERWLETMGAEQSDIKRLQSSQVHLPHINCLCYLLYRNLFLLE